MWLTYADLDTALLQLGYTRHDFPDERIYRYAREPRAILTFPPLPWNDPVRAYHHVSTREIIADYGIVDEDAFELLLLRIAHRESATVA